MNIDLSDSESGIIDSKNVFGGSDNSVDCGVGLFCSSREVLSGVGVVIGNELISGFTFKLSIVIDGKFPAAAAGQFIMIRLFDNIGLLLGRPLAIYRVRRGDVAFGGNDVVEVIYFVVGRLTGRFSELVVGSRVYFWGPLGRGFDVGFNGHTILVAGGVGYTPFLMLAECLRGVGKVTLLYGARSADRLAPLKDFADLGVDVRIATDDGSVGFCGVVTKLLPDVYENGESARVLCCGPAAMLKAAFNVANDLGLPCVVSLETPMSCGLGLCYGCVVKVKDENDPNGWSYKRTCVEGPAFDAYKLVNFQTAD
ncbi:MAG: dihydroorotate dehydrogenase electron transfer subunit [Planctomycetaceae bacterium]|nr:dihydroorotate dehydrogenase electron transfer subunit [Planctomycetaceae bacterium]